MIQGEPSSANHGGGSEAPAGDMAAQVRARQLREHLENRLRIKKSEITERRHRTLDLERSVTQLEAESHHLEQDVKRVEGELREFEITAKKEESVSKLARTSMDDKDKEIHRLGDEGMKLEHEISRLRTEIGEKERKMAELKEESRGFVKAKEEFRRQYELEHFSANAESDHAHNKHLEVLRFSQERQRKEDEIAHKRQELSRIKQELVMREQEVMEIEGEMRRGQHSV